MIESLVTQGICETFEEAIDFIDYNTIRTCAYYPNSPIIIQKMNPIELYEYIDEKNR